VPGVAVPKVGKQYYTDVEKDLKDLAATIEKLKGKKPTEVALPSRFSTDDFNVFSPRAHLTQGTGEPGMGGFGTGRGEGGVAGAGGPGGLRMPSLGRPGIGGRGEPGIGPGAGGEPGFGDPTQQLELPEHCMVRLIDVTVQPGKRYEYRLAVRMGNPNKDRKREVASPTYATEKELVGEWSDKSLKNRILVTVPPELHYYLVDQKEVAQAENPRERYRGPNVSANRDRQVVMQAHRWLQTVRMSSGNPLFVGDWAMAERFIVNRG
jgi:hypothetical protein